MKKIIKKIARLDAHHRLLIALGAALIALVATDGLIWPSRVIATWVAYALTVIGLTWLAILTIHPREAYNTYRIQDSSRWLIFLFVILAATVSLGAVVVLLTYVKQMPAEHYRLYVGLSAVAVISSWWIVQTLFVLRYAHLYYGNGKETPGGLKFPDTTEPDYLDFAYLTFGVGMTAQVADIGPMNRRFRRLVLWHSILSFGFNTSIIALTINVLSGLL